MTLETVQEPVPGPGEVRIRNHAAALNFFDVLQVRGKYQVKPPFPFIPGAEVSGVVDAIGEGVTDRHDGDAVIAITRGNGFAECSIAKAANVFTLPAGMTFEEGAALPIAYHTSYFALQHRALLQPEETLLVHAGASGVGMSAIQIGKALGARVIATASNEAKRTFAAAQGADHVVDYTDAAWIDRVKALTNDRGADVIYDPVGGDIFDESLKCIAPEGRLLVVGFASGQIPTLAVNRVLLKNISIVGVLWGGYLQAHPEYAGSVHLALMTMYRERKLRPAVGGIFPFEHAPVGLRELAERKVIGKAVLTIDG
jgi:NADPH2:quinone reductase